MPFQHFIEINDDVQWTIFRPLLRELAAELERAQDEDSLPTDFCADNIWLDRGGQLKLVEIAVGENRIPADAKSVFDELFGQIIQKHPVPAHVFDLHHKWRAKSDISLGKIVDSLDDLVERPSSWTWIDRIGATCVSMIIEISLLFLIAQAWLTFCSTPLFEMSVPTTCGIFFVAMMLVAFLTGYFLESPSFWFLGITVRKRDKQRSASRIRLGCRMAVSWILPALMVACTIGFQGYIVAISEDESNAIGMMISMLAVLLVSFLMLLATLFNLAKPSRGLADLICGTLLMRK